MKQFFSCVFIFVCSTCFSQSILKISSHYFSDYSKDKVIVAKGDADYLITFNNKLKILRIQGPNNFDHTMEVVNYQSEGNDQIGYELNWNFKDDHILGMTLITKPDGNNYILQIYNDHSYRYYNKLSIFYE